MVAMSGPSVGMSFRDRLIRFGIGVRARVGRLISMLQRAIAYADRLSGRAARPPILVGMSEHHQLNVLAMISPGHDASDSDALFYELDRARVVHDDQLADGVIRMGSTVTYQTDAGDRRRVTLVYPEEQDARSGRISILSPVGTALIGLQEGQSIDWRSKAGHRRTLQVLSVARSHRNVTRSMTAR